MRARAAFGVFAMLAALLLSCEKHEVDADTLNNNPFDRDYTGESVFVMDSAYLNTVTGQGIPVAMQVMAFHVRSELLLSNAAYQVHVQDLGNGQSSFISPLSPGTHRFEYARYQVQPGVEVCLELALSNNNNAARHDLACATLQ